MSVGRNGYTGFRNGSRFVKLVTPRGGRPTHRLTGKVIGKSGDDLIVQFDDQTRTTLIAGARRLHQRGLLRRQLTRR